MSKPWVSDRRQRRSKRYLDIHAALKRETAPPTYQEMANTEEMPKRLRKFNLSKTFRQHGGE